MLSERNDIIIELRPKLVTLERTAADSHLRTTETVSETGAERELQGL